MALTVLTPARRARATPPTGRGDAVASDRVGWRVLSCHDDEGVGDDLDADRPVRPDRLAVEADRRRVGQLDLERGGAPRREVRMREVGPRTEAGPGRTPVRQP